MASVFLHSWSAKTNWLRQYFRILGHSMFIFQTLTMGQLRTASCDVKAEKKSITDKRKTNWGKVGGSLIYAIAASFLPQPGIGQMVLDKAGLMGETSRPEEDWLQPVCKGDLLADNLGCIKHWNLFHRVYRAVSAMTCVYDMNCSNWFDQLWAWRRRMTLQFYSFWKKAREKIW